MLNTVVWNYALLIGSTSILLLSTTGAIDNTLSTFHSSVAPSNLLERSPKFILPPLLTHMNTKKSEGESVGLLSRPFSRKVSKEARPNRKGNSGTALEHKTTCEKKSEAENNEQDSREKGKVSQYGNHEIQVEQDFGKFNKNLHRDSSMIWSQSFLYHDTNPIPFNPLVTTDGFQNHYRTNLLEPPTNFQRDQKPLFPPRAIYYDKQKMKNEKKMSGTNEETNDHDSNNNFGDEKINHLETNSIKNDKVVSQGKKFIVTNVTKYVLDFYCPHCGGEISVSRGKNRGLLNREDDITVNKGRSSVMMKLEEERKNKSLFPEIKKTQSTPDTL